MRRSEDGDKAKPVIPPPRSCDAPPLWPSLTIIRGDVRQISAILFSSLLVRTTPPADQNHAGSRDIQPGHRAAAAGVSRTEASTGAGCRSLSPTRACWQPVQVLPSPCSQPSKHLSALQAACRLAASRDTSLPLPGVVSLRVRLPVRLPGGLSGRTQQTARVAVTACCASVSSPQTRHTAQARRSGVLLLSPPANLKLVTVCHPSCATLSVKNWC